MTAADIARLVALAAIWGAAFIFMRVAAPVLGPAWTPELRVLIGGLALLAWFRAIRFDPGLRVHWRFYLLIGTVNIAIPFVLYSFASMHAPASLLSITNAVGAASGGRSGSSGISTTAAASWLPAAMPRGDALP